MVVPSFRWSGLSWQWESWGTSGSIFVRFSPSGASETGQQSTGSGHRAVSTPSPTSQKRRASLHKWRCVLVRPLGSLSLAPDTNTPSPAAVSAHRWFLLCWAHGGRDTAGVVTGVTQVVTFLLLCHHPCARGPSVSHLWYMCRLAEQLPILAKSSPPTPTPQGSLKNFEFKTQHLLKT